MISESLLDRQLDTGFMIWPTGKNMHASTQTRRGGGGGEIKTRPCSKEDGKMAESVWKLLPKKIPEHSFG